MEEDMFKIWRGGTACVLAYWKCACMRMSQRPLEETLKDNTCVVFGHAHTRTQTRSRRSAYPLYRAVFTEGDGAWNAFGLPGTRWRNAHTYAHSKGGLISSALLGFIDTLGNHSLISPQRKEKYTDYMNVCEKEREEETERMMGERKRTGVIID